LEKAELIYLFSMKLSVGIFNKPKPVPGFASGSPGIPRIACANGQGRISRVNADNLIIEIKIDKSSV
jgi:hypothetical protein